MSKKFGNSKATSFLEKLQDLVSLDSDGCDLSARCKFNFSYFDRSQDISGEISDWEKDYICDFFNKLSEYCKSSLSQLQQIGVGKRRNGLLSIYDSYPANSNFEKPKHVPHQARWGRFRLDNDRRLVGFVVPDEYHGLTHSKTGICYDRNTFYVVFIDNNHDFYPMRKR
jgi:hypothetical protein